MGNVFKKIFFSLLVLTFILTGLQVHAATYTVNTSTDEYDASCSDGDCSLRDAILLSNTSTTVDDTITFDPTYAPYNITLSVMSGTNSDRKGDLDIKDSVTIVGLGESDTIINGGAIDRVFDISGNTTVTMSDLTIEGGFTNQSVIGPNNVYGGGISIHGSSSTSPTLIASNITIQNNEAEYSGGGIYCNNALVQLDHISFLSNTATRVEGGGLWLSNCDSSTVSSSLFDSNVAGSDGGGLFILHASDVLVSYSLFSNNTAIKNGGAINVEPFTPPGSTASLSVVNSTMANNTAVLGGGLYVIYDSVINLHSVTIAGNSSTDSSISGAGIFNAGSNSTINIKNSLVAGNTSAFAGSDDCYNGGSVGTPSYFNSYGYNGIPTATCNYTPVSSDVTTESASFDLDALADNGGSLESVMIGPDSAAINAGDCSAMDTLIDAITDDQRGEARDSYCDIGAVETIPTWHPDADGDGFGDENGTPIVTVDQPEGYLLNHTDCQDSDPGIYPGAEEICDGVDNNCDDVIDENLTDCATATIVDTPASPTTWYNDADGDGFGDNSMTTTAVDQPAGYVSVGDDCDDEDSYVYPGAEELCDGIDNNCDGNVDENLVISTYYPDVDGDGFGDASADISSTIESCDVIEGYSDNNSDCNDADPYIYPGAEEICDGTDNNCDGTIDENLVTSTYYPDVDGDGYGDASADISSIIETCDAVSGYVVDNTDCNDSDAGIYPGTEEICDGADNNCDGAIDEGMTTGACAPAETPADPTPATPDPEPSTSTWYTDADGDGYGDASSPVTAVSQPEGTVTDSSDCNDTNPGIYPGAEEICDGADNNCDGSTDENLTVSTYYVDQDGDGFGDPNSNTTTSCSTVSGYVTDNTDCDDVDALIYPGAEEICDSVDNNCDGNIDEGMTTGACAPAEIPADPTPSDPTPPADSSTPPEESTPPEATPPASDPTPSTSTWYTDADGDGYGDVSSPVTAVNQPAGTVADSRDCNDIDSFIYPGAEEICDGIDNNCDGATDENLTTSTYYVDQDGDGFGDPNSNTVSSCDVVSGYVTDNTDCNDTDPYIYPGAEEICDNADNNCDGATDEGIASSCNPGNGTPASPPASTGTNGSTTNNGTGSGSGIVNAGSTTGGSTGSGQTTGEAGSEPSATGSNQMQIHGSAQGCSLQASDASTQGTITMMLLFASFLTVLLIHGRHMRMVKGIALSVKK